MKCEKLSFGAETLKCWCISNSLGYIETVYEGRLTRSLGVYHTRYNDLNLSQYS